MPNSIIGLEMASKTIKELVKQHIVNELKLDIEITLEEDGNFVVEILNAKGAIAWDKSREKALEAAKSMAFSLISYEIETNNYTFD